MADEKQIKIDDPFKAFDDIEKLGKIEKEAKITDDLKLFLSTISAEEESEIFADCHGYEGVSYISRSKIETLARAIKGINGQRFDYDKIEDVKERSEERLKIVKGLRERIGSWRDEVVTFLYDEWLQITGNSEEQLKKMGIVAKLETIKALEKIKSQVDSIEVEQAKQVEPMKENEEVKDKEREK